MSTPIRNDEKGADEDSADATSSSKDIIDVIQVTNEFAFVGETSEEEEEEEAGDQDCLFVACPVDPSLFLDEHVTPKVDETTKSILGALDEHVVPKIETAKEHSIRTMDSITTESQRLLSEVKENSKKSVDEVQRHSQAILDRSKSTLEGVTAQAMAIVDEKVKPEFQNLVETSQGVVRSTSEECQNYAPCYIGTAPGLKGLVNNASSVPWYWVLLEASLRAFGRVVFCDNPITGIFIWFGIMCASPLGAFCSLLSVLTVNVTAMYFDMDKDILESGQYARNAVLIGTGFVASFDFDFPETGNLDSEVSILLFLSVALAPATLLVESIWIKKVPSSIPSLLLPYNIVLLATLVCAKGWNFAMATQIELESPTAGILLDEIERAHSKFRILEAVLNGLSKIFFVEGNSFAGFLILVGVLFCSRIVAASLLAGSFVSSFVLGYVVFQENHWYLNSGYAGFNPALCVAGIFFYLVPSWKLTGLAVFAIVATVIVQGVVDVVLGILGTPVSTSLGFCITLIPLLAMDLGSIFGNQEDYFIRNVPESELSTPEEYLKSMVVSSSDHPTDSSSDEDDDVEENALNEETPLLA